MRGDALPRESELSAAKADSLRAEDVNLFQTKEVPKEPEGDNDDDICPVCEEEIDDVLVARTCKTRPHPSHQGRYETHRDQWPCPPVLSRGHCTIPIDPEVVVMCYHCNLCASLSLFVTSGNATRRIIRHCPRAKSSDGEGKPR